MDQSYPSIELLKTYPSFGFVWQEEWNHMTTGMTVCKVFREYNFTPEVHQGVDLPEVDLPICVSKMYNGRLEYVLNVALIPFRYTEITLRQYRLDITVSLEWYNNSFENKRILTYIAKILSSNFDPFIIHFVDDDGVWGANITIGMNEVEREKLKIYRSTPSTMFLKKSQTSTKSENNDLEKIELESLDEKEKKYWSTLQKLIPIYEKQYDRKTTFYEDNNNDDPFEGRLNARLGWDLD